MDLNAADSIQLEAILFMEGQEPVEIAHIKRDMRTVAADAVETGAWLSTAMEATWAGAPSLLAYPELAGVVGDRHRIIANDWQAANVRALAGRTLARAVDILDHIEFTPAVLRVDLAGRRQTPE